jgi:hypothetical protein
MKRFLSVLLCMVLLISYSATPVSAGSGEGNIDNGGGSMGKGTAENIWHTGHEGVRITVVRAKDNMPVSTPIDLTNKDESDVVTHFGKVSKLHYKNGASLSMSSASYIFYNPSEPLPKIISDGGGNTNIEVIRSYFTDRQVIKSLAALIGTTYEKLTNGSYKLLLEPIAYFTFNGQKYAMTATEVAIYDKMAGGGLRSKMVSLTHQNLPLSMFLEHSDMGYPAYTGATNKPQSDSTIISSLGLGIVKFREDGDDEENPEPHTYDATYRTNTDVITSVTLDAGSEITPDSPAKVTFHILGSSYTRTNIVIPEDDSQLVWVKWHTPDTPQTTTITVSSTKGTLSENRITANIIDMQENTPPDPTAKDRNDKFKIPDVPSELTSSSNTWSVWSAEWVPVWEWEEDWDWESHPDWPSGGKWVDHGEWVDNGYWEYDKTTYRATLTADMDLEPDDKVPTANGKKMRSGYGVKISVDSDMRTSGSYSNVTGAQTVVTYFPEFAYSTYWRVLDLITDGLSATFAFKKNIYSTYNRRVHFTPLWYPDGKYTAYTVVQDAWTPSGMLSAKLTDYVNIDGNVYDDWHVAPLPVN